MRVLDRYISWQVLSSALFGVVVLSMVLLFGNLFKEIRPLMVEQGAPLTMVLEFVSYVLPFSLKFTLAWGFLTAILLVFGRLSTDNELTAMRMGGLGLSRLAVPVFGVGLLLTGFSYWLNTEVAPASKGKIAELLFNTASQDPKALLREGQLLTQFKGQKMLVERREGDKLIGFHLYQEKTEDQPEFKVKAAEVELDFDKESKILQLTLFNANIETVTDEGDLQLMFVEEMPWKLDLSRIGRKKLKASRFTNSEIDEYLAGDELPPKKRVEFMAEKSQRTAFSFACLALGMVGIPLGVRHQRRETSAGFGLGIGIAVVYFILMTVTGSMYKKPGFLSELIVWLPNILCVVLGVIFFRRARYR